MRITNREFVEKHQNFNLCCKIAEITPTMRQASKFRNGRGLAYKVYKRMKDKQKQMRGEG